MLKSEAKFWSTDRSLLDYVLGRRNKKRGTMKPCWRLARTSLGPLGAIHAYQLLMRSEKKTGCLENQEKCLKNWIAVCRTFSSNWNCSHRRVVMGTAKKFSTKRFPNWMYPSLECETWKIFKLSVNTAKIEQLMRLPGTDCRAVWNDAAEVDCQYWSERHQLERLWLPKVERLLSE